MTHEQGSFDPHLYAEEQGIAPLEATPSFYVPPILEHPEPTSATPLGLTTDPHIRQLQQEHFYDQELPVRQSRYLREAPVEVQELAKNTLLGVQMRRGIENGASYYLKSDNFSSEIKPVEEAAIEGRATPYGLFLVMKGLQLPSIELVKTTFEAEQWMYARQQVRNSMLQMNPNALWCSDVIDKPARIGQVVFDSTGENITGFTMRVRKFRGEVNPQMRVREQISVIIRTDELSGFDEWLLEQYKDNLPASWQSEKPSQILSNSYSSDSRLSGHAVLGTESRIMRTIAGCITNDFEPFPPFVIPVTQTMYAYDETHPRKHLKDSEPASTKTNESVNSKLSRALEVSRSAIQATDQDTVISH